MYACVIARPWAGVVRWVMLMHRLSVSLLQRLHSPTSWPRSTYPVQPLTNPPIHPPARPPGVLLFVPAQVTGGSALGIVSTGTDSLMASSVQPSLAGGGYSGAALPGQQNGMNGMAMGPQPEAGNQDAPKKSGAAMLGGRAGQAVACVAGVLGLVLPALLL